MTRTVMLRCAALCVATLAAGPVLAASCELSAEAANGAKAANACKACHTLEADAKPRPTGPNLHDVFERKAGTDPGFTRYSKAMNAASEKGLVWTAADLQAYVADPKGFLEKKNGASLPHGMFYQLKDAGQVATIVSFLKEIKGKTDCP